MATNRYNNIEGVRTTNRRIKNKNMAEPLHQDGGLTKTEQRAQRVSEFRREASRKAAMANKRIMRLEKSNLTDSPAYRKYVEDGKVRFGVRGKTYREVQQEMRRLDRFLDSETSTIRGVNRTLKAMAENTGIKYKNLTELRSMSSNFFRLAAKVEEYLRATEDMASAIGYQRIWEVINEYVKTNEIDLSSATDQIDQMTEEVARALTEFDVAEYNPMGGASWYQLKKE